VFKTRAWIVRSRQEQVTYTAGHTVTKNSESEKSAMYSQQAPELGLRLKLWSQVRYDYDTRLQGGYGKELTC